MPYGHKQTEETRLKISASKKGKCLGHTHGFKKGQISWNKGKHLTEDQKNHLSLILTGKKRTSVSIQKAIETRHKNYSFWHSKETIEKMVKNHVGSTGKTWKYPWDKKKFNGNDKQYLEIHRWVYKSLGKPTKCEQCQKEATGNQMNWANKSQEYKKLTSDWIQLCPSCHAKYDLNFVKSVSQN